MIEEAFKGHPPKVINLKNFNKLFISPLTLLRNKCTPKNVKFQAALRSTVCIISNHSRTTIVLGGDLAYIPAHTNKHPVYTMQYNLNFRQKQTVYEFVYVEVSYQVILVHAVRTGPYAAINIRLEREGDGKLVRTNILLIF